MQKFLKRSHKRFALLFVSLFALAALAAVFVPSTVYAAQCGSGNNTVTTAIDIGCRGSACVTTNPDGCNAIMDATFAIIRLLSAGVGIVVVGSVIFAGIQYTTAREDPGAVGKAKDRIRNSLIALVIFIFGYAILNFAIPAGFFR